MKVTGNISVGIDETPSSIIHPVVMAAKKVVKQPPAPTHGAVSGGMVGMGLPRKLQDRRVQRRTSVCCQNFNEFIILNFEIYNRTFLPSHWLLIPPLDGEMMEMTSNDLYMTTKQVLSYIFMIFVIVFYCISNE